MKIEEQVTSLDLSKKLKELGVKQESAFYWEDSVFTDGMQLKSKERATLKGSHEIYSAFTVAELGETLPAGITAAKTKNGDYVPSFPKGEMKTSLKKLRDL